MNKAQFLAQQVKRERLELGEPAGHVWVHEITEAQRSAIEMLYHDEKTHLLRPTMLAYALHDDDGRRLFEDSDEDIEQLRTLPARIAGRCFDVAMTLGGFDSKIREAEPGKSGSSNAPDENDSPTA